MDIYTFLRENRLNRKEFAKILGIDASQLSGILNGRRFPSAKTALKVEIATGGKVKAEDFIYDLVRLYKSNIKIRN